MSRQIRLDGIVHSFPDDATDAEIAAALDAPPTTVAAREHATTWRNGLAAQPGGHGTLPDKPAQTPSFLQDLERGAQGLATTLDLIPYAAEQGLRRVFGSENIDATDRLVKGFSGTNLVGTEGTDALVRDVHTLQAMPANPTMSQAGQAFQASPTTVGGLLAGAKVIASNPSVIPHIVAEMAPSLPLGGVGGKLGTRLAAPLAEQAAVRFGPAAAKVVTTGAFGAGMNTTLTATNAGANVSAQVDPSGVVDAGAVGRGVKQTAGQIPGAFLAGALLPAGMSRITNPAVNLGVRVLAQSAVQGAGNIASVTGGNVAIGKETTPGEIFAAGASGLATGPMDLAARAIHGRKAAFDRLMSDFAARRSSAPDIDTPQAFGSTPHEADGVYRETPEGVIADESGAPVAFGDHKAAARFAAGNELGGSHELATARSAVGETVIVLRRRSSTAAPGTRSDATGEVGEAATPWRVVAVDGVTHKFPADATDGEIAAALRSVDTRAGSARPTNSSAPTLAAEPALPLPVPPESPVLHGDALRPDPGPLVDGEQYVTTPAGNRIRSKFEVVDSSTLKAAEGELQNRDRSRDSTDLQVNGIVSGLDPSRLGASAETDRGAPIVGPDHIVESGNGRMLALNRIQSEPANATKAEAYRAFIESQGHSTEGVANPILIRRRTSEMTPEQRRQFVIDSNKDAKLALTSVERARSDADALDGERLALFRGGDVGSAANAPFVKAFNAKLMSDELAGQIDATGATSQDGMARIENALMARAYENPAVLSKLIEARDNNIRSIGAGMLDNAGPWAQLRAEVKEGRVKPEFDITDKLVEAARRVSDIRAKGAKIGDALSQVDAFDKADPVVESLMRAFYNPELTRAASREAISSVIATYARRAAEQTTAAKLFEGGDTTPAEILEDVLSAREDAETGDMFAVAADRAAKSDDGPESPSQRRERRLARNEPASFEHDGDKPDYSTGNHGPLLDAYDPDFATASFTNRASIFNGAAEALGLDPDKFTLMPAPRQVSLLQSAIKLKFGVEMIVDKGMQERFAIDQMLDAYQNLQGMAHVLDLPNEAINLGGNLRVKLQKDGRFLGMFQPGANVITLPKRSNSFAHEWGHALDFHLLDQLDVNGKGLTGALRQHGDRATDSLPGNLREAFVDLLNAMFFDKAGVAHRIMELEAKIAKTTSAKVKAEAQLSIDKLKGGNSQVRDIRSAFFKGAKAIPGPASDYWTSPTEMFARAFEAYTSYKVEAAGLTAEFIGKGDAGYLSDADKRFALTFPKGEERARIFAAFEQVFGQIADAQMLAKGPGASKPAGTVRRMTDYDRTPAVKRERGIINRELGAIRRAVMLAKKAAANRPDDAKGLTEKIADLNGVTFMSMTGNLRMIQGRSNSPSLRKLIDLLTKQDGRGDRTVARTFAEDVHLQSKTAINRLSNIVRANNMEDRDQLRDMVLRDLLTGVIDTAPAGMEHYTKGAAAIRHILDNEFYVNQQAGIDLGYTRNGYLARVLDMPKVYGDQPGFLSQASKVYEIVFDKEYGIEPADILGSVDKLADFMKLARFLAKDGRSLPSLDGLRKLLAESKKLESEKAGSGDPDAVQAKIDKLQPDIEQAMGDLIDEVRPAYSKERAEAWLSKINLVAGQEHNAASPDSKYTKKRELPPEADKIMEKYYLSDPIESVTNYLVTSARRTAYARRFGNDGAKRLALFEGMAAEGVSPDDQRIVAQILDTATGRIRSELPKPVQGTLSAVNAIGVVNLLGRAVLSSLAEPFTAALVTGDARDGFKVMGMAISGALGSPNGKVRYELARAMGIISDAASDDIMESRYGQTYADSTRWDRYTSTMFRRTGLTALTRAQKTAAVGLGHAWLDNLSQTITSGSGTAKDQAVALMREMGVRDPAAFAKQIVTAGRMPTPEEIDSDFGHDYATAQLRFSQMVIQEPGAMDRPLLSQNPVGRVIYGITGFSYGYWRNIVKRNAILISETGKRRGSARGAMYGGQLFAAAALAYLIGLTVSTIRERLLNPSRYKELEADGQLESTMAQLAFTRTFSFGAADMAIQTWSGLKYQRDLSNSFVGPGLGATLQSGQKVAQLFVSNSRKTNTAEYNAAQGTYALAAPFLSLGLARIPGGPLIDAGAGVGMAYVTSPAARDSAARLVVGPKDGSMVDGKKTKSGPTAWDKMLDGALGKVERKKAHPGS